MSDKIKVGDKLLHVSEDNPHSCPVIIVTNIVLGSDIKHYHSIQHYHFIDRYSPDHMKLAWSKKEDFIKITSENNPCPTCKERLRCLTK